MKNKETSNQGIPEQQAQPEHATSGGDGESVEWGRSEEDSTMMPIKGSVKWQKPRSPVRVTKKPDRWGNNFEISRIEQEYLTEEASLPSVIEIPNPNSFYMKLPLKKLSKNSYYFKRGTIC